MSAPTGLGAVILRKSVRAWPIQLRADIRAVGNQSK